MSSPFIGEIRLFALPFAPSGWALCNGSLLSIAQNVPLFSIIGTYYGGNGATTFAVPNIQARMPIGAGAGTGLTPRNIGDSGGAATVTLSAAEIPPHNHFVPCVSGPGNTPTPSSAIPSAVTSGRATLLTYATSANTTMRSTNSAGSAFSHENMPPGLVVNFCIALTGLYPSRG